MGSKKLGFCFIPEDTHLFFAPKINKSAEQHLWGDYQKTSPLWVAARKGHHQVVRQLLESKANQHLMLGAEHVLRMLETAASPLLHWNATISFNKSDRIPTAQLFPQLVRGGTNFMALQLCGWLPNMVVWRWSSAWWKPKPMLIRCWILADQIWTGNCLIFSKEWDFWISVSLDQKRKESVEEKSRRQLAFKTTFNKLVFDVWRKGIRSCLMFG